MSKPNQLFLLADHIKLSLLERQRAQSLNLEGNSQDGHISRSIEQFRDGLDALKEEEQRLRDKGNEDAALNISDALPSLQKQLDDLTSQFHGFTTPSTTSTLTHPNDPSLASDFAHATTVPAAKSSSSPSPHSNKKRTSRSPTAGHKSVRFSDTPAGDNDDDDDNDPSIELFARYRDDPGPPSAVDRAQGMTNEQIHAYHANVLDEQDEQLDRLGETIGRQRELSMRMGDELEAQIEILDETDAMVDRHQSRLDRASRSLGRVARSSGETRQMAAIIITIIILVLLIIILK